MAPLGAGTSTLTYTYDAAGRRTQMQVTGQTAVTYGDDDAHRITGITQGTKRPSGSDLRNHLISRNNVL